MTKSKRGGAGPYRKGAAYEREIQAELEEKGWLVVRQPKSQSPFDLIAIDEDHIVMLVQCKLRGKLPKSEREELLDVALRYNAEPILAYKDKEGNNCLITLP